jgi:hypothetical protein
MKKLYQGLMIIATAALTACSSMEVNDADAVAENYPEDFDAGVYLELHPILLTLQKLDYVSDANAAFKASMDSATYVAKVNEDSLAFAADTASVHTFYTSPKYAGFNETTWDSLWIEKTDTTILKDTVSKISQVTLDTLDADGKVKGSQIVYVDSVSMDSAGELIAVVYGKLDSTATEAVTVEIDRTTISINNKAIKKTVVEVKDVPKIDTIPPGLDASVRKYVFTYNIYGATNDLAVLENLTPDTEAAALQFIAFGKSHGWAYRRCKAEEQANTAVDPIYGVEYPATKLYCDDNGTVREIK